MSAWLKGLLAAVIGAVANSITVMLIDPLTFNWDNIGKVGIVALISAIVALAMYLKDSPLPEDGL